MSSKYRYQVNHRIRAPKLRVIANDGENLGEMATQDALKEAHKSNLDLVVIAEKANPPVAKLLDFNKYLYEEKKKASAAKSKSKKSELKELRFGPNIGEGDLNLRIKRATEFVEDGDQVRIKVRLKGRQRAFPEKGFEKIEIITKALEGVAKPEKKPKLQGNEVTVTFTRK